MALSHIHFSSSSSVSPSSACASKKAASAADSVAGGAERPSHSHGGLGRYEMLRYGVVSARPTRAAGRGGMQCYDMVWSAPATLAQRPGALTLALPLTHPTRTAA